MLGIEPITFRVNSISSVLLYVAGVMSSLFQSANKAECVKRNCRGWIIINLA